MTLENTPLVVTLYGRKDCHLCAQAQADLQALQAEVPHQLKIVDIESDARLLKEYLASIPVVVAGPYRLRAPFASQDLLITLKAAQQRQGDVARIEAGIESGDIAVSTVWTGADRFSLWLSHHYLAVLNLIIILYLGLPFLAPVLMKAGLTAPAGVIYKGYSFVCHQLPYRSWFLFGEQAAYPRALANIPELLTFNQATGIAEGPSAEEIYTARAYVGDEHIGYKVALCQRDVGIYGAMLAFGFLYGILRALPLKRPFPALHWILWVVIGILPMGLDGGTQLLSQYFPIVNSLFPLRESTPFLRSLTGILFGLTTAWFGYPMVEESMADTRRVFGDKFKRVRVWQERHPGQDT